MASPRLDFGLPDRLRRAASLVETFEPHHSLSRELRKDAEDLDEWIRAFKEGLKKNDSVSIGFEVNHDARATET